MSLQAIMREMERFDEREFVGPIREQFITQAEQQLGVSFPQEFRQFLLRFGSGSVSSESFIGLGGAKHLDIVWLTQALRKKPHPLPVELLPIRTDGFGNYDCIDTSQPTANGDYAIVEWVHDAGGQKGRTLAAGYFGWFLSILDMIRDIER